MQSRALFPAPPFVTLRDAITAVVMWNPLKVHCSPLARMAVFTTAHIYRFFWGPSGIKHHGCIIDGDTCSGTRWFPERIAIA
jgi:hypothetical protein